MAFAAIDMSGWAKYADNLINCTASSFSLPDPLQAATSQNPESISYQIVGMDADICKVTMTRTIQVQGQTSTMSLNCAFKASDLPIVSKSARNISTGTFSTDDPASNIISTSCQQAK